ncbi:conserved hypothetical protein [Renibacterium salmoninarum ATCC 33209]|uniref:Gram-positive cocci surface proteins LPxTG domain-containing protein n=3 Tax=Renibacterium salmoninarum TaxID=1646 RepID=A9WUW6_RENSM|nr:putative partial cell-surface adhesin [Renibacterium salmoninarum]ABY24987.1 conserved hypothetical protein [Renibacterium salmoninarum ATCC 33209]
MRDMKSLFYRREDESLNSEGRCGQGFRRATVLVASLGVAFSLMGAAIPAEAEVPPLGESSTSQAATAPATDASAKPDEATPSASATESPSPSMQPEVQKPPATDVSAKFDEATPSASAAETPASIAGFVFDDKNGNGDPDPGEPGIAGSRVLPIDRQGNAALDTKKNPVAEQLTDDNGRYHFPDLAPGSYVVKTVLPVSDTYTTPEYTDPGDERYKGIINFLDVKAGETGKINYPALLGDVAFGGVYFEDLNRNGVLDLGEPTVAGVKTLLYASKQVGDSATDVAGRGLPWQVSNADGFYGFKYLAPDACWVTALAPTGYEFNQAAQGSYISLLSPVSAQAKLTLGSPSKVENVNFALVKARTPVALGLLFEDKNGDGIRNEVESGLPGVEVNVLDSSGSPFMDFQTTTGADGSFSFSGLPVGYYQFGFFLGRSEVLTTEPGSVSTAKFEVPVQGQATVREVGVKRFATIQGSYFIDDNGNGKRDPGEAGANSPDYDVRTGPDQPWSRVNASSFTDIYFYQDLRVATTYQFRFRLPAGYEFSPQCIDPSTGKPGSDADVNGVTPVFSLNSGQDLKMNVGIFKQGSQVLGCGSVDMVPASAVLANTGAAGTIIGFAVGGGLLVAGAASVFFARRRREA